MASGAGIGRRGARPPWAARRAPRDVSGLFTHASSRSPASPATTSGRPIGQGGRRLRLRCPLVNVLPRLHSIDPPLPQRPVADSRAGRLGDGHTRRSTRRPRPAPGLRRPGLCGDVRFGCLEQPAPAHPADLAQSYATASGRDLDRLGFYIAFYIALGYFKIAVIAEGIHARHSQGLALDSGSETVGAAPELLAAAGLDALKRNACPHAGLLPRNSLVIRSFVSTPPGAR